MTENQSTQEVAETLIHSALSLCKDAKIAPQNIFEFVRAVGNGIDSISKVYFSPTVDPYLVRIVSQAIHNDKLSPLTIAETIMSAVTGNDAGINNQQQTPNSDVTETDTEDDQGRKRRYLISASGNSRAFVITSLADALNKYQGDWYKVAKATLEIMKADPVYGDEFKHFSVKSVLTSCKKFFTSWTSPDMIKYAYQEPSNIWYKDPAVLYGSSHTFIGDKSGNRSTRSSGIVALDTHTMFINMGTITRSTPKQDCYTAVRDKAYEMLKNPNNTLRWTTAHAVAQAVTNVH